MSKYSTNKKLKILQNGLNKFINKQISKGRIPNRDYLDNIIESILVEKNIDFDDDEQDDLEIFCNKFYQKLEKFGIIYKAGNKNSYIEIVKNKGYISCQEYDLMKSISTIKYPTGKLI
ncbi:hypothetical protein QJ854_gp915 [Moumouvirus goulette]|uniref:Uncharacterized protein n=1 Tax=Moumouvirus goulette TaxID=1247379 RepID=M1PVW6_9VIRU|nr:hypothetical protein QJ854_gp915 [Moumouvirus goulette]AGF84867.1 hypothetical protein glt_00058 [Moumouvirus goulette]